MLVRSLFIFHQARYGYRRLEVLALELDSELMRLRARGSDSKAPGRLQILHYNIERFPDEIKDLRGLETLLVARSAYYFRSRTTF
jgi:hypothetical protein